MAIDLNPEIQTYFKVLLISEDPKQTDLYTDLVREVADCQVDIVSRIESSFEWVNNFTYNLVVVDHPSATLILERIKRVSPVTSVILISDAATVEQAVTAMRLGAEDYMKKPINIEAFQLAVKRGLDRKAVFEENAGASHYLNLLNSCQMISASFEQERIFGIVRSYLSRELQSDHSAIYAFDEKGELKRRDPDQSDDRLMEEILEISLHTSNVLEHLRDGQEVCRFVERGQLTPGVFAFRFQGGEKTDYFCVCLSPKKPDDLEGLESRLRILRAQIEVTGANILQYQGVQQMVYLDDATGLYNTRYLHYILDRQIAHSQANQTSFAVLFIDADRFKSVNDQHGHLVGTGLLNELGHQLRQYVRETDTVFRYGGDEFVAVLSPCDLATGQAVAERIRSSIEAFTFASADGLKLNITVSIGVALFPEHADSKKTVINAADQAMYSAKKTSRNCVFVADLNLLAGDRNG
ncbi:MAG: diguanylate cyclase [Methylotenera sp.]|nr:diguanylate cyclase [Oligoflexia bacterium]